MKITTKSNTTATSYGHYGFIIDIHEIDNLVGKLLTIIETLGLQQKQEESLKDIVKQTVRSGIGSHDNSYMSGEMIQLIFNFNRQLEKELIKEEDNWNKPPQHIEIIDGPVSPRDGDYELKFTSRY